MKKITAILLALTIVLSLSACGQTPAQSPASNTPPAPVSISILLAKPEIASQFEEMAAAYSAATGVKVTVIPRGDQDVYEKMTSLYASGNAPTISMVGQEFSQFSDKFADLTKTSFAAKAGEGTLDFVTIDGKVLGVPVTVEAYGIIYNPAVVSSTLGSFDPTSIRTQDGLKKFFGDIQTAGSGAFTFSTVDWSLGAHLTNTLYTAQSANREARHQFIEDLKAGKVSLMSNTVFNGWVDFVDMLMEYNIHKASPLAPAYEDGSLELGSGDAAAWFMGNWAYPDLVAVAKADYRFIPIPVSNNAADYANNKIAIGVPSYWCVDTAQNTPEQQQAAIDFLTWFIETPQGQDYYVNKLNFIPSYSGFAVTPSDSMSKQISELLVSGNSLEWMNNYYPAGGYQVMGAALQKYVDGVIDRAGLAKEFEDYWKSVK